ncbi:MAG: hypothetical protein AB8B82_05090 [Roseovarius sp.]
MKQRDTINDIHKDEKTAARSAKARGYARWMVLCLMVLCLSAIWQDKRLAPPVHDGMQHVSELAMGYINSSEALSQVMAAAQEQYAKFSEDG